MYDAMHFSCKKYRHHHNKIFASSVIYIKFLLQPCIFEPVKMGASDFIGIDINIMVKDNAIDK